MKDKHIEESSAPLMEHLIELRRRLIYALLAVALGCIICWVYAADIYTILTAPLVNALHHRGQDAQLIFTALQEAFFTYLRLSLFGGFCLAFPVVAFQAWRFVAPGLYTNEQNAFLPFLLASPIMFCLGASFVYFAVMPLAIDFFLNFQIPGDANGEGVKIEFLGKVNEYLSIAMTFILSFGLCFQLPVLLTLLGRVGILTSDQLAQGRKYALVGIFAVAAVVTPPDVLSQIGLGSIVYLLYEISIHLVRMFERQRAADSDDEDAGETLPDKTGL